MFNFKTFRIMKNSTKQVLAIIGTFVGFLVFAILGLVLSGKFLSWGIDKATEKWPVDYDDYNAEEQPEPAEGAENPEPGQGQEKNNEEEEKK